MRCLLPALLLGPILSAQSFVNYESPQTHPLEVSPDGLRLLAVNTPDNRLAVYSLATATSPVLIRDIQVGLEPVTVRLRTADEAWVVNRISDSISIVSLSLGAVVETLSAKDEPADVVFAGNPERAFVCVSGSREVRVFDPVARTLVTTIPIFGDEPRALATDGTKVWCVVHRSGNKTTIVPAEQAPPPPRPTNPNLPNAPQTGLIVGSDDPTWRPVINVVLPDFDVTEIDVATRTITRNYTGVGTINFGIARRPADGSLWVANTEARNLIRFEPTLRGHTIDSRVTRIDRGTTPTVTPIDLNPGINYAQLPNPAALGTALSQPTDLVFDPSGTTLYVAAMGTDRIGVLDGTGAVTARIEVGPATGTNVAPRTKRGPRGLAHHPTAPLLYVLNRLSETVAVVDTATRQVVRELAFIHDPTPVQIREGRGFLYDAKLSGNGTNACASCHIDGDLDGLAWDLGDPAGVMQNVQLVQFHPMKGPMTTQALKGMTNAAPFHWRGDRANLQAFNPAFDKLMGGAQIAAQDMNDFAAFMASGEYPPNPNRNMDNTVPTTPAGQSAADGLNFYVNTPFTNGLTCNTCHTLPTGGSPLIIPAQLLQESQGFKVPHLRNMYKKQGRIPVGGQRISGFGVLHDGSVDRVFDFLTAAVFNQLPNQPTNRMMLERFVLSIDTGHAPCVGYSRTVTQANAASPAVAADLALLTGQANTGNIDLVAKGRWNRELRGFRYDRSLQVWFSDRAGDVTRTQAQLLAEVAAGRASFTFQGVDVGSGIRIGINRDLDGWLDGDEVASTYGASTPGCNGDLVLAANSPAALGNGQFALTCTNATPGANGFVMLGLAPANLTIGGLTVLVDPTVLMVAGMRVDAQGLGLAPLPVPADPSLTGGVLHAQALCGSTCAPDLVAASQGIRFVIGR